MVAISAPKRPPSRVDLTQAARGGVWLEDSTRPPTHHRFSLNIRNGAVRPGSLAWTERGRIGFRPFINGLYEFSASNGSTYLIWVGYDSVLGGGNNIEVRITDGWRPVGSSSLSTYTVGASAVQASPLERRATSWAQIGDVVAFAGPLENSAIGVVQLEEDGSFTIGFARGEDRGWPANTENPTATTSDEVTIDPTTQALVAQQGGVGPGDDLGPYDLAAPRAIGITAHQDRFVAFDADGNVHISNLFDVHGWPTNLKFRIPTATVGDPITGAAPGTPQHLLIEQRTRLHAYTGPLSNLDGELKQVAHNVGCVGWAALQIMGGGLVAFLSEQGPMMWASGAEIPMSGVANRIGGPGSIYPLFTDESMPLTELERYRPDRTTLGEVLSRFSAKDNAIEWAFPVQDTGGSQAEVQTRIRFDFTTQQWSIERHPSALALAAVYLGDDQELLLRVNRSGHSFIEGIGDLDYVDVPGGLANPLSARIDWQLQIPVVPRGSQRVKVRAVQCRLSGDHTGNIVIDGYPEHRDLEDGTAPTARHLSGERADLAFGTGSGASTDTDGFRLGVDRLRWGVSRNNERGLPPHVVGSAVYLELRPLDTPEAHRTQILGLQAELLHDGRVAA